MQHEPTNGEILSAVNDFATYVEERFDRVDERFIKVESDIHSLKSDMVYVKSAMVTKDYLDDKLANQFSDLVKFFRRELAARGS